MIVIDDELPIHNAFSQGEIVYLKTDTDSLPRMVVGFCIRNDRLTYLLAYAARQETEALEMEITPVKPVW